MTDETIVAVYDTAAHAEAAAAELRNTGVPDSAISLHTGTGAMPGATTTAQSQPEQGFWSSLFGGEPDHDTTVYDRSMSSGSTILTVKTPETHISQVMQVLEGHHPIDIDERAAGYGLAQTTTTKESLGSSSPAMGATGRPTGADGSTIELSEESLTVGKRVVNRSGTRIRRYVVETPVEENVTLHDEKVTLNRRPVTDGRPVTGSFSDKTIEMMETAEEAVVSKTARVVEEVGLHKESTDRVETIRDTVRKEEVEVEQIPTASSTATSSGTSAPHTPKI